MKLLDLFCGMGGFSIGFHREGFHCLGVDQVDVGYPYDFIQSDIRKFHTNQSFDVVIAGPPCTEFSPLTKLSAYKGQREQPNPEKGMELVREAKRLVDEIKPRFWMIENVAGSIQHIEKELGSPSWKIRPWYLWGNLPPFLIDAPKVEKGTHAEKLPNGKWLITKRGDRLGLPEDFPFDPMRSWKRARFPLPLSLVLAKACKATILGG